MPLLKAHLLLSAEDILQVIRDVTPMVLSRALKLCNFLDWKDIKVPPMFCTLHKSDCCCCVILSGHVMFKL